MSNALIPRESRVSAITSVPQEDGGLVMVLASAQDYYDFEKENGPWDLGCPLPSREMMRLVKRFGVVVSQEIFDTVWPDAPFTCVQLISELSTIRHLAPKTQHCIINAVVAWLTIQDSPQCHRRGGRWVLGLGRG